MHGFLLDEAGLEMGRYIQDIYGLKKQRPGHDIFSALIAAEEDGERLSRDEIVSNIRILYIAGHETTTNLIGNGLVELCRNPGEMAKLRTDQSLDANLVEEVLRYNSPVHFTRRITTEDMTIAGTDIAAGSVLLLRAASANRDPRKWGPMADRFLIDSEGANDQLSFGGGRHFCVGAALARLEGQIALPQLVRRFPKLAPAYEEPSFSSRMVLRGCTEIPVNC